MPVKETGQLLILYVFSFVFNVIYGRLLLLLIHPYQIEGIPARLSTEQFRLHFTLRDIPCELLSSVAPLISAKINYYTLSKLKYRCLEYSYPIIRIIMPVQIIFAIIY